MCMNRCYCAVLPFLPRSQDARLAAAQEALGRSERKCAEAMERAAVADQQRAEQVRAGAREGQ